jgi:hypothetical protein
MRTILRGDELPAETVVASRRVIMKLGSKMDDATC